MMKLVPSKKEEIRLLTDMSKKAFDSDVTVGAKEPGGPPEYDSESWHEEMRKQNHLYAIYVDDTLVGGMLLFEDENDKSSMFVGRIFVDPKFFKKGYGYNAMKLMEQMFPEKHNFYLDTPIWNVRTNQLYTKLGYQEVNRDQESVYYKKTI